MKKLCLSVIIFSFLGLVISNNAYAGAYVLLNVGNGGEVEATSIGGEIGLTLPLAKPNFMLGLGFSLADIDRTEYYTEIIDKEYSDEWELYLAAGVRVISNLYLVATGGYSAQDVSDTLHKGGASAEGFDREVTEEHFAVSGQLRYIYKNIIFGGGYHNRRGVIGAIGVAF